jgi:DNA-binding XRE family transcriptional regulator
MNLTKEQREAKQDRNQRIRKDYTSGMTRKQLANKYELSPESIYNICRDIVREFIRVDVELTTGELRIREKYRNFDLATEIGKASPIRYHHLDLTVHPKRYSEHFSQVIWR